MSAPTSDQERALAVLNERHAFMTATPQRDGTYAVEAWQPRHSDGYVVNADGSVVDRETNTLVELEDLA